MHDIPAEVLDAAWAYAAVDGSGDPLRNLLASFGDPSEDDLSFHRLATLCLNDVYSFSHYWTVHTKNTYVRDSVVRFASGLERPDATFAIDQLHAAVPPEVQIVGCDNTRLQPLAASVVKLKEFFALRSLHACYDVIDCTWWSYSEGCYTHHCGEPHFSAWVVSALLHPSWNRCLIFHPASHTDG